MNVPTNRTDVRALWQTASLFLSAVLLSGALITVALPPSGKGIVAWFPLAPVFYATRNTRFITGFTVSILASFFAAFLATKGVFYSHGGPTGEPAWIYVGCTIFGIVFAFVAGISAEGRRTGWVGLIVLSALGVMLEYATLLLMPAPFEGSQSKSALMLMLASITGIWGIGFSLWLVNLAWPMLIDKRSSWLSLLLLFCAVTAFGLPQVKTTDAKDSVTVGVVQAFPGELFTKLKDGNRGVSSYLHEANLRSASLVVLPEFGGLAFAHNGKTDSLTNLAHQRGIPAFVTTFWDDAKPLPHNASSVFDSTGESERYFKQRLFGSENSMSTPGSKPKAVESIVGKLGLNICYDSCFPSIIRETARLGADIIALPTIDPDSPYGFFAANHAALSPIRSAENGVSIIRCDGYAYSSITDPNGREVLELFPDSKEAVGVATIPRLGHKTVYRALGDWFVVLCGLILAWWAQARIREIKAKKA